MLLRLLTRLPAVALQSALAVPVQATRRIATPTADAARMAAELVNAGARGAVDGAAGDLPQIAVDGRQITAAVRAQRIERQPLGA
ncbi:hypothetical protein, partial [Streptomyces sp. NPDC002922]|uniref:hypothetical protein n=1 Tax=Streptomyces sp. NPDC002922 TaxID=3154439 RepID=UPI0033BA6488